jgi:hypothetical protein
MTTRTIRPDASAYLSLGIIAGVLFALWTYIWIRHGGNGWQAMLLIGGGYALWCLYISRQTIRVTDEGITCQHFLSPSDTIPWTEADSIHLSSWAIRLPQQAILSRRASKKSVKIILKLYSKADARWLREVLESRKLPNNGFQRIANKPGSR